MDARGLLKAAIRDPDPVLFLEHKKLYRHVKLRRGRVARRGRRGAAGQGRSASAREADVLVVTYGAMVYTALEAASALATDGIELEVLDLRSLVPLDEERLLLESVRRINKVLLLHEDTRTGGMASELAAIIAEKAFEDLDGPIVRVTAPDTPVPYAASLEDAFIPQVKDVVEAARELHDY